ncbi:MAG: hypothetical protein K8S94_13345 [Planctomycetia bacterium]|nr:hypothetical protein [Planctomycetia bacterium]
MPRHAIQLGTAWEPPAADGRWLRRFGRPSGVGPGDAVVMVVERAAPSVPWRRLLLNDVELSFTAVAGGRHECDVTTLLRDRNELLVVPETAAPAAVDTPRGRPRFPEEWGRIFIEIVTPH